MSPIEAYEKFKGSALKKEQHLEYFFALGREYKTWGVGSNLRSCGSDVLSMAQGLLGGVLGFSSSLLLLLVFSLFVGAVEGVRGDLGDIVAFSVLPVSSESV